MAGGRPTDYKQEFNDLAIKYITNYADYDHKVPSVVGLAVIIGCAERSLYNWGNKHPEFMHTLKEIVSTQKFALTNGGLGNDFNSNICKLMLANHGFSERTQDVSGQQWNDEENKWEVEITHTQPVDKKEEVSKDD